MREATVSCASGENLQALLDSLPQDGTPITVRLPEGEIRQRAVIRRANTRLQGAGHDLTKLVFGLYARELLADGYKRGTFRTATLMVDAPDVTLAGLTVENDAWPREKAGQAIALYADGDRLRVEDCRLTGGQDTLFAAPLPDREIEPRGFVGPKEFAPRTPTRQLYLRCEISGDIDFIFGGAAAWFEACDIIGVDRRADQATPFRAYATAPCTPRGQRHGFVFHRCRVMGRDIPRGSLFLGRPWRECAKTVYLQCEMDESVAPAGFDEWCERGAAGETLFAEFGSSGPGGEGVRAPFARQLSPEEAACVTLESLWAGEGMPSASSRGDSVV